MAAKLRSMLGSPGAVAAFRSRYAFPEGVEVRLAGRSDDGWTENVDGTPFPLIAIVEGGLRFPLHPFLTQVLNHYELAPIQLSPNAYRIVMGVAELNNRLNLNLGLHEFDHCYSAVEVSGSSLSGRPRYYFRAKQGSRELVQFLPSSGKGVDEVTVRVKGPWEFGAIPEELAPELRCPRVPGPIG